MATQHNTDNTMTRFLNQRIHNYLLTNGKMSGYDICDDCGVEEADVAFAMMDGAIVPAMPAPGGTGAWYTVDA